MLLPTEWGSRQLFMDLLQWTCYQQNGEGANFLWTCYRETGVMDFGLYSPDV